MDTVKGGGIKKTVLLATSSGSRTLSTPLQVSFESMKVAPDPHQFTQRHLPVAVLLEGRFPSIFRNRVSAAMRAHIDSVSGAPYRAESVPNKMIVVSDGDLITNVVSPQDGPLPMGMDLYTRQQFSNREFFLNCLDYLTDAAGLMSARNKDFTLRLLDAGRLENEKYRWQAINFAVPVLFVLLFAAVYSYVRRRKYTA
jgi:gliding-associated putative ABC transporter substrate-binding component GldG